MPEKRSSGGAILVGLMAVILALGAYSGGYLMRSEKLRIPPHAIAGFAGGPVRLFPTDGEAAAFALAAHVESVATGRKVTCMGPATIGGD